MFLRAATETDCSAIADLTNIYIRDTAIHFSYEPISADDVRQMWAQHSSRYPWLVAEVDGRFAGFSRGAPWRARDAYAWCVETAVYVHPDFHRRGVGKALYTRLLERLRAQGFHTAIGGITLPNEASVRLHESCGFVHIGVHPRVGWKFGRWHDVGFWQLMLQGAEHQPGPLGPPV